MAAKQDLTSSKTAHVMNLLSRGSRSSGSTTPKPEAASSPGSATASPPSEPEEKPVSSPAPAPQQATSAASAVRTAGTPPVAPIISIMNADAEASASIKAALEATMQDVPGYAEPEPEKVALPKAAPTVQAADQSDAPAASISSPEAADSEPSVPAASSEQQEPLQEEPEQNVQESRTDSDQSSEPPEEAAAEPTCYPTQNVNIMQLLVQSRLDKYIQMFGLCDCPQCRADVEAIALNNLPAKYVVMPDNEISPRLSVFEKRYSTELTAQILRACKEVMDHPRHDMFKNYYNK